MCKIRQIGETLDEIRDDHKERYRFAAKFAVGRGLKTGLDVGCGVGYGSYILATEAGLSMRSFDRDEVTIDYAKKYWHHENIELSANGLEDFGVSSADICTMFEVIEHTPLAIDFMRRLNVPFLVGSVPNQDVVPFTPGKVNAEHYRHFTPEEIADTLRECGWRVIYIGYQPGKRGDAAKISKIASPKRTIVFIAERM